MPLVYGELRRLARRQMRREGAGSVLSHMSIRLKTGQLFENYSGSQLTEQEDWPRRAPQHTETLQTLRSVFVLCGLLRGSFFRLSHLKSAIVSLGFNVAYALLHYR
jgi:hypothetical protein